MTPGDKFQTIIADITTGDGAEVLVVDASHHFVGDETVHDQVEVLGLLEGYFGCVNPSHDVDMLSAVLQHLPGFIRLHFRVVVDVFFHFF